MNHFFDVEEAERMGLENAVILHQVRASGKECFTASDVKQMLPYITEGQIKYGLRLLKDLGFIKRVCMYSGDSKHWAYLIERHGDLGMFGNKPLAENPPSARFKENQEDEK